jgi:hypothetical protein
VKIACAKDDGTEAPHVQWVQRRSSRQPHFDWCSSLLVNSFETGGQCGGVVGYDYVVGTQKIDECCARYVNQVSLRVDYEKFCIKRTLDRSFGGNHD